MPKSTKNELPTHTKSGRKINYDEHGNDIDVMNVNEGLCKLYLQRAKLSGKYNQLVDVMEKFYNSEIRNK